MSAEFERVVEKIDPHGKLLRAWALHGGVSAQVTALQMEGADGQIRKVIVRQHGAVDLRLNPNIAVDEFRLLSLLQAEGIAAPTPIYADQSGEIFANPYIVSEYIEGEPEFAPADPRDFLAQLADHLARIHEVDNATVDLSFLPEQVAHYSEKFQQRPAKVDDSIGEGRIRAALEAAWPFPRRNRSVLLHGDYWPGNLLWKDGRLAAVIDWENAHTGDPLEDVANTRLELLWALGFEAMEPFTQAYRSRTGIDFADLPYWDLCAALRPAFKISEWAADAETEQAMRAAHQRFVTQAFDQLSG